MLSWQKAEHNHSSTVQRRIASAIIKQLITWQISAITVRRGQMPRWEARGSAVWCGWRRGAGAWANKSPISKIISVHKQIEAAGDEEAFLGHSAKQINHLFSYAVWVAVAVISGEPFVCLRSWCAEHHSMIVAPGRHSAAASCLFSTAYSIHSAARTCSMLLSVLSAAGTSQRKVISPPVISPSAIQSSNSPLDKMSGSGPV